MAEQLIEGLEDFFSDVMTVERAEGVDAHGEKVFGASFTVKARIVGRTKLVADTDGNERVSSVQATVAGSYDLSADDRFTLPLRFSADPNDASNLVARQPRALAIDRSTDENGAHHETVQFSNARIRSF